MPRSRRILSDAWWIASIWSADSSSVGGRRRPRLGERTLIGKRRRPRARLTGAASPPLAWLVLRSHRLPCFRANSWYDRADYSCRAGGAYRAVRTRATLVNVRWATTAGSPLTVTVPAGREVGGGRSCEDMDLARLDDVPTRPVVEAEIGDGDLEVDDRLLAGVERHASEGLQLEHRTRHRCHRVAGVDLHDLVAAQLARVANSDGHGERVAGGDDRIVERHGRDLERRVRQAEPERVERAVRHVDVLATPERAPAGHLVPVEHRDLPRAARVADR